MHFGFFADQGPLLNSYIQCCSVRAFLIFGIFASIHRTFFRLCLCCMCCIAANNIGVFPFFFKIKHTARV